MSAALNKCLRPIAFSNSVSLAILILRVVTGIAFAMHGWGKMQSPFSWLPPQAPIAIPSFFQFLAAISEFGGGIAWALGLLMPLASFGIGCTMVVAVYLHMMILGDPFVNMKGGSSYELALIFLSVAILFFNIGPGKYSLDAKIFGERG